MTKTDGEDGTHNTVFSVDDVRVFLPSVSSQQRFGGWDLASRKMIGSAEECNGLYILGTSIFLSFN
ncbi:uncharacterized protein G2W53_040249 [Senna tora]|uniref:Uncharacterized protein n=1 Tax=Senna tora TaxID=362788 RepID=A0A834SP37_9FABA|nr:uncharacterized protein G2W53_040249 [Senna tora]